MVYALLAFYGLRCLLGGLRLSRNSSLPLRLGIVAEKLPHLTGHGGDLALADDCSAGGHLAEVLRRVSLVVFAIDLFVSIFNDGGLVCLCDDAAAFCISLPVPNLLTDGAPCPCFCLLEAFAAAPSCSQFRAAAAAFAFLAPSTLAAPAFLAPLPAADATPAIFAFQPFFAFLALSSAGTSLVTSRSPSSSSSPSPSS